MSQDDIFSNTQYCNPNKTTRVLTSPDIEGVEVCAVEDTKPKPGEEEDEEAVVEVADAVAGEHAVVLTLENTHSAN